MSALVVLGCAGWIGMKALPPTDAADGMHIHEFGKLPVVYQGRVKPFDTLARNTLTILSDRQEFANEKGKLRPAIEWLLDVMSNAPRASDHRVFRIYEPQLLTGLGLEARQGYRYAYNEFKDRLPAIDEHAEHAQSLERDERDLYDNAVLEFSHKLMLYQMLGASQELPRLREDPEGFRQDMVQAARRIGDLDRFPLPHVLFPRHEGEPWLPFLRGMLDSVLQQDPHPAIEPLTRIFQAWAADDTEGFNGALAVYQDVLKHHPLAEKPALAFEAAFNHFAPFYHCSVLYVLAFLVGCFSWLSSGTTLNRVAFAMIGFTFLVHTYALGARVYISGYPPITNLYGTAIFIGWGCVVLGLFLESIYRLGIGNLIASIAGFLTLLIAHFLAGDGDTLEMMQAVLDTKFWLATHVIIINFGYAATFLAGGLAVLYILRGVLTRSLDKDTERVFGRMIYGVVCFALLMSFVGTVLGGLWADDSWGRFWGWDPKENGALIIVLWNGLILHARWGGMIKTRGLAVLSVFGNIVTSWSWFGVNQLGIGLHSYGFTESITFWLIVFVASQLVVIGVGLLPRTAWRSSHHFALARAPRAPARMPRAEPTAGS
jgi:ABC-type transport system involved in cytochrome c biogenesis permease subunit